MTSQTKSKRKEVSLREVVGGSYGKIWNFRGRYVAIKGSRASKKSKTVALWIISHLVQYPEANAVYIRKTERTLKDSCYADCQWAIHRLGLDEYFKATVNPLEIKYLPTGQKILFRGCDDPMKLTSLAVPRGYLCWAVFEEAYEVSNEETFDMIDESIRGQLPPGYFHRVFLVFNPWSDRSWLKARFFDTPNDDNKLAVTKNYECNEWLAESDLKQFEDMKKRNPCRYRVAGLGEWGVSEGLVFEKWKEQSFDYDALRQKNGIKSVFGLDFGYSVDPSAMVIGLIDPGEKMLYIWDEMYKPGMSNEAIAGWIQEHGYGKEKIVADSAEPKSIDRLKDLGVRRVKAAKKGPDSIRAGIDFLQDFEMIIHPRCCNFLTEISQYAWAKDKFGKLKGTPVDEYNHLMDALRYGCEEYMIKGGLSVLKPRGK